MTTHFLKRLEVNGFKSFAGKTEFEFLAGITAIVGPNGSGKSNVVDAIRWLLGERDAKNLRGGKVEDLIFAGTPKRPRLGQARASLYFENKENFFPIEAAEVCVTREVSRDGGSRYFINKSEVLLRDLIDFLARARLGSRGLVVVTQGNSDMFIRSSPSERREMIEEILGLREYQIKRFDAERRLKNTKANLEKAVALIEEITPHLRSLRRQTARWEKRGELTAELRDLEDKFFGAQLSALQEEIATIDTASACEEGKREALEERERRARARQAEVEASHPEERKRVRRVREEIRGLLDERNRLEKTIGGIEARLELADRETKIAEKSAARMLQLLEEVRDRLEAAVEGDEDALREALGAIIEDISAFFDSGDEEDQEDEVGESANHGRELEKFRKEIAGLGLKLDHLIGEERALEARTESFYAEFKEAVAEVENAKEETETWEARHRERQFEKEKLLLRKEELVRQLSQAGRDPTDFKAVSSGRLEKNWIEEAERRMFKLRGDLASVGEIDEALVKETRETETRHEFLKKESEDLAAAARNLEELIRSLTGKIQTEFDDAVVRITAEFGKFFELMFGGGHAKLKIVNDEGSKGREEERGAEEGPGESQAEEEKPAQRDGGVEIEARLPRKKVNSLEALSGGERSLVGIAALFALISVSPPPFLVLDEVDAALDDRNSKRFADMLKEFSKRTQFIVVTHNRSTMEAADVLYGVTLDNDGTSKVVSMKFETLEHAG